MAITTSQQFLDLLEKSEILEGDQLQQARDLAKEQDDAKSLARQLLKEELLTKWQAGMLLAGKHTLRLGKYKLLEQLGRGEMSHVHLAQHQQMGRRVALRTLSQRHAKNPQSVKKFIAEARQVSALDHPNLIHVYDIDSHGDRYFLVTEYVKGRDLKSLVEKEGPLPVEKAAEYLRQAATGLAYAHQRELSHRGIKPANLLIDSEGGLKVIDLGIAELTDTTPDDELYRAPEQSENGDAVDHRADIYSLGCTAYFLLTGEAKRSKLADVPPALRSLCKEMTAQAPEDRPDSAEEIVESLEACLEQLGITASHDTAPQGKALQDTASGESDNPFAGFAIDTESAAATGAGMGDFAIDVGGGGKRSNAAESVEETDAAAGNAEVESNTNTEFSTGEEKMATPKKPRVGLIIAGGTAFSSLLTAAGILLLILLLRGWSGTSEASTDGDGKSVAQADGDPKPDSDDKTPGDGEKDPESGPGEDDPDGGTDSKDAGNKDGGDEDGNKDGNNTTGGNDPDKGEENPDPKSPDENPQPDPKKPDETDPPQPKPDPKPEPKPTPKPKPDTKPDPKPEPKPKPPPKPVNPFEKLATAAELPDLDGGDATTELGTVTIGEKELIFIDMYGGDKAVRGRQTFSMLPLPTPRQWAVKMENSAKIEGDSTIANIKLDGQKLMFSWTEQAKLDPLANHVRNCVLSLRTGRNRHQLALRQAVQADPPTITFDKPAKAEAAFDWAPDPSMVRVEIYGLDIKSPTSLVDPRTTMPASKGTTDILVGTAPQILYFKITSSMRRSVQLSVAVNLRDPNSEKPIKFTKGIITKSVQGVFAKQSFISKQIEQLNKVKAKNKQAALRVMQLEKERDKVQQLGNQLAELDGFQQALDGKARIHYRVYYTAGQNQIDLIKTTGAPAEHPQKKAEE